MTSQSSWAAKVHLATLPQSSDRDLTEVADAFAQCAKTLRTAYLPSVCNKASHYQNISVILRRLSFAATTNTPVIDSHRTAVFKWRHAQRGENPVVRVANSLREQLILLEGYGLETLQNHEEDWTLQWIDTWNAFVTEGATSTTSTANAVPTSPAEEQTAAATATNGLDFSSNIRKHFTNQWEDPSKLGNTLLQRFSNGFQMAGGSFDDSTESAAGATVPQGATELRDRVVARAEACLGEARSISDCLDATAVALTQLSKQLKQTTKGVRVSLVPAVNQALEKLFNAEATVALEMAVQLAKLQQEVHVGPLEEALIRDEATWRQLCGASRSSRERTSSLDSVAKRSIASLMMDDNRKESDMAVLEPPVASKVTELSFEAYQTSATSVLELCEGFDFEVLKASVVAAVDTAPVRLESIALSATEISDLLNAWADEQQHRVDPSWPGEPLTEDTQKFNSSNTSLETNGTTETHPSKNDTAPPKWLTPLMTGSDTILRKMMKKPSNQFDDPDASPETSILVSYFLPDVMDDVQVTGIVASFACSFRDKSSPWPTQYGRLFCTQSKLVYCSWTRRTLTLRWKEMDVLEPIHNTVNESDDDSLLLRFQRDESHDTAEFVFSGFHDREKVLTVAEDLKKKAKQKPPSPKATVRAVASEGPDPVLAKMEHVLTKRMSNLSIQELYDAIWSEDKPFYKPWLERSNCFEVNMGSWAEEDDIVGPFCKEAYTRRREIFFKFKRTTHLYIGPPIANVKQVRMVHVVDECN